MKKMIFNIGVILISALLTSCTLINNMRESGEYFWCNQRYLDKVEIREKKVVYTKEELELAKKGFIYSTLGAIVLQDFDKNPRHTFSYDPKLIKPMNYIANEKSGFQAKSYIVNDENTLLPKELVIVFSGSNQLVDWIANARFSDIQYAQALNYFNKVTSKENLSEYNAQGINKIVVTGYSLGGALAGHLGKNPLVKNRINEVWLFNPSPRINSEDWSRDPKFWFAAARNDVLRKARTQNYRDLFIRDTQYADDFFLVKSKAFYAHSRWVLARNMLWAADLAYVKENRKINPAMDMIKLSTSKACPITLKK